MDSATGTAADRPSVPPPVPPSSSAAPSDALSSSAPSPKKESSPPSAAELAALKVVPARHYWRWVAGAAALVVVAQFVHGLVTNPGWDWDTFFLHLSTDTVLKAVWVTLQLTAYGTALGFALGVVLAFMRLSRSVILQTVAWTYIWAFRSIPLIVQLLFWFNLAYLYQELGVGVPFGPVLWSFDTMNLVGAMSAAVIGLALHQAAYAAEIVRGGIISVESGQLEAAAALGIPRLRQIRRILLPQAMRGILPNAANEVISLFKGTSIVSVMAIGELFYQVQVIYGRNGRVVPLLMVATAWYILLTTLLSVAQYYVERHFARGAERTAPPTPLQRARSFTRRVRAAAATGGFPR
ncbi:MULTISPECIES: amino acid ABC transporter permease [unclassified Streptomyces]|uniref:amino acid ABC transporter permease n=1 Tax=unclassified Streptomyces TaxID=2593676 RepID=UPI00081EB7AA|nr:MULTISPECIES: amino acid ABC transporter permease [unclassified Streptomyces]MYZ33995.1 ABC transporter permease subunit [Streptomyces sp. SID4917]SCF63305.1 amino acid ABC transporter membrane protein, PAAT family [Streptomyces sp. MnatMP-M17]